MAMFLHRYLKMSHMLYFAEIDLIPWLITFVLGLILGVEVCASIAIFYTCHDGAVVNVVLGSYYTRNLFFHTNGFGAENFFSLSIWLLLLG